MNSNKTKIRAVILDFGGVLAEEGFREGLMAIARSQGLNTTEFFNNATSAVYDSGYITGNTDESSYWNLVRKLTGVRGTDRQLRNELLSRFVLRTWMLDWVRHLRRTSHISAILSDQTDWLDTLNQRTQFFREFDYIFNSYHLGISKRDPDVFRIVSKIMDTPLDGMLFVDDNAGHVSRAETMGVRTILYQDRQSFEQRIKDLLEIPPDWVI
jgi:putative hydrolase of the HAD superfamily